MDVALQGSQNGIRSRVSKLISFGLNDILFTPYRLRFAVFDFFFVVGLFLCGITLSPFEKWGEWHGSTILSSICYAAFFEFATLGLGFYDRSLRFSLGHIFRINIIANLFSVLMTLSFVYFFYYGGIGRWSVLWGTSSVMVGVLTFRFILSGILSRYPYRFTIIGNSEMSSKITRFCESKSKEARMYKYMNATKLFPKANLSVQTLLAQKIVDIVITKDALNDPDVVEFCIQCLQAKIRIIDEITFFQQIFEKLPIDSISKEWVLQEGIARRQVVSIGIKRWLDILLSFIALVILSPFLLLIAVLIKFSSKGDVLFIQPRQGRYCAKFNMYKFRTMHQDQSDVTAVGGFTKKNDARVTWVGKFLRPMHLDELPQLLNILVGHMSLVGPRPEAVQFAEKMRKEISIYDLRYLVRPGLTGFAQLNQGYAMDTVEDTKEKLSYDIYYLIHYSFWVDIHLILKTFFFLTKRAR